AGPTRRCCRRRSAVWRRTSARPAPAPRCSSWWDQRWPPAATGPAATSTRRASPTGSAVGPCGDRRWGAPPGRERGEIRGAELHVARTRPRPAHGLDDWYLL